MSTLRAGVRTAARIAGLIAAKPPEGSQLADGIVGFWDSVMGLPASRHDHAEPDLPRFPKRSALADRPHEEEYTNGDSGIRVSGMTCGHCEMSVREEVRSLGGVKHVGVSAATGELVVTSGSPSPMRPSWRP